MSVIGATRLSQTNTWLVLATAALLFIHGCSGTGCAAGRAGAPLAVSPAAVFSGPGGLPVPSKLAAGAGDFTRWHYGADYAADLPSSRCTVYGSELELAPTWYGGAPHVLTDAAYAVFRLKYDPQAALPRLDFAWSGSTFDPADCWLGLSDWARDSWAWQQLPSGGTLELETPEAYADASQRCFLALVLVGDAAAQLSRVGFAAKAPPSVVVDTGQDTCFNNLNPISAPQAGQAFYGQDAQYAGPAPSYTLSQDGLTVYDNNTGLTWMQSPDTDGDGDVTVADKFTWDEIPAYIASLNAASLGGFSDWRLPTIKELYSLIDFRGTDPSGMSGDTSGLTPYIDRTYFLFSYGDTAGGERVIDSQYASSSMYLNKSWNGSDQLFGVNFADGRIKGYDLLMPGGNQKTFTVLCVRGRDGYAENDFVDNGDGTVTDRATGLMWQKGDSGAGMFWQDALAYAEALQLGGHADWRLPNAKELQSIVDYTRSPDSSDSPALDPIFNATQIENEAGQPDYACYWTSTTHISAGNPPGGAGIYVAFGRAMGYMQGAWHDVHGAGAQRSDPKEGDPADFPFGRGPQGDAIRIFNYARCVRDAD